MKFYMGCAVLASMIFSSTVYAGRIDCGYVKVQKLYVQSDRTDGGGHNNKLLVQLAVNGCPSFGYVENDAPAYTGILSMLLAAKMSDQSIRVVVNDGPQISGASKIEWVNFD